MSTPQDLFGTLDAIYDLMEVVNLEIVHNQMLENGYSEVETDALVASLKEPTKLLEDILPGLQMAIDNE